MLKAAVLSPLAALGLGLLAACSRSPHVSTVVPTPKEKLAAWDSFAGDLARMDSLLKSAQAKAEKTALLAPIRETIHLVVDGKVAFTAAFDQGKVAISRGAGAGEPTLVLPVTVQNIENLDKALDDGKLDDQELFNFATVLFAPCVKRMFAMPYLMGRDISAAKLHDFVQLSIKNPSGLTYHGKAVEIQATLVNVDGQFLVYPGFQGDPDLRLAFTVPEAQDLYRLSVYDYFRDKDDDAKISANVKRYLAAIEAATVYRREAVSAEAGTK